jgi:hypothetical protein
MKLSVARQIASISLCLLKNNDTYKRPPAPLGGADH